MPSSNMFVIVERYLDNGSTFSLFGEVGSYDDNPSLTQPTKGKVKGGDSGNLQRGVLDLIGVCEMGECKFPVPGARDRLLPDAELERCVSARESPAGPLSETRGRDLLKSASLLVPLSSELDGDLLINSARATTRPSRS